MHPDLRVTRILWFGLFASTFAYVFVLAMQGQRICDFPPCGADSPLLYGLGGGALSSAVASVLLSRRLMRAALPRTAPAIREEQDPSQVQYRDRVTMRRLFADPASARRSAIAAHKTPFIVGMALAESVAIYGLVLGLLGFPPANVAPFFAGCWILMACHFPRVAAIERALEGVHRAKFE